MTKIILDDELLNLDRILASNNNDLIRAYILENWTPKAIQVQARVSPMLADIDKGLGKCMEKNCNKFATIDYNGHKHYVCKYHYEKLTREFEEDYD